MTVTFAWDAASVDANTRRLLGLLGDPAALNATLETEAATTVREHIERNYVPRTNKLGGESTGYWKNVAESTEATSGPDGVTVRIRQIGLRIKYHGGVIVPSGRISEVHGKPIRMLSIPVHAAAHGRTIMDLGGHKALYRKGLGIFKFTTPGRPMAGDPLYYILRRSVTIRPDPGILPPDGAILNGCMRALAKEFE
jgi:hypothetical protein